MISFLPVNDIMPHDEFETTCPCGPALEIVNGEMLLTHNSFDGRELAERKRSMSDEAEATTDFGMSFAPEYIGVKRVKARPMTQREYSNLRGYEQESDQNPPKDGFMVQYEDGYISWCPKLQFDNANRPITGLTFGHAIEAIKKGFKVARVGWNGKGMWLCLIMPGNASHLGFDMQPCIGMKTALDVMQPGWLASQQDMLSDDWQIVE